MIEVRTEIKIEAPPDKVWNILTDLERYSEWNPFVRGIHGDLREGAKLEIHLGPPGQRGMKFKPAVTKVEPQKAFHWNVCTTKPAPSSRISSKVKRLRLRRCRRYK